MYKRQAINEYPALKEDHDNFKNEYGSYKEKYDQAAAENTELKALLQDKDKEILELSKEETDSKKLRDKMKTLQKQVMDLTKENELLKGKL